MSAGSAGAEAGGVRSAGDEAAAPLALVTGASGFVGSHIVDALLARGVRVRVLVRDRSPRVWLEGKPVEAVSASLTDLPGLRRAVEGVDWVVHAAGQIRAGTEAELIECNVRGTERLLRAASEAGSPPRRFVFISSLAAAGPSRNGEPVSENRAPTPVSGYGRSKLMGEEVVLGAADRLPVAILRPPAVYGPRDRAILRLFTAIKWHVRPVLRDGGRFSLVYISDLANAVHAALTREEAVGEVFFLSEPEVTDYDETGYLVQESMGGWTLRVSPPKPLLVGAALGAEALGRLTGRSPIMSRDKLREITSGDWICSSSKIRSRLGWSPRMTLREGIRATTDWYRGARWL